MPGAKSPEEKWSPSGAGSGEGSRVLGGNESATKWIFFLLLFILLS
jgi:hypothetical protein